MARALRIPTNRRLFFLSIYAFVLLGLLLVGFLLGMNYGNLFNVNGPEATPTPTPDKEQGVACTLEALQCPDGSYVGRTGPNCQFVCPQ